MGRNAADYYMGANVFLDASKTLNAVGEAGLSNIADKDMGAAVLARMIIPGIVMQAFAAELYLKAIIQNEGLIIQKSHRLDKLFGILDVNEQQAISTMMILEMKNAKGTQEYDDVKFQMDLAKAANTFEDWRYFFESGTVNVDLTFMKVLNSVLCRRCKELIADH